MRALVTGAAGFIGSRITARLTADGHQVVALDDLSAGSLENLADAPGADFVQSDIRDLAALKVAAAGCDVIFHEAAKRSVPFSLMEPVLTTEVNVLGTLNVMLAAAEVGARVVWASSSSVYGDQEVYPQHEGLATMPMSPYAASKASGESYARAYWRSVKVPTVSLRYFNVYGPRQDPNSEYAAVIPRFITACMDGTSPVIYGDGEQARDFTYIDDVVEANLRAASAPESAFGRAFNIGGGGTPTTINTLLRLIGELTGTEPKAQYLPEREGDLRYSSADVTSARESFGHAPSVEITEGLKRTVEWFRDKA